MAPLSYLFDTSTCIQLFEEIAGPSRSVYRERRLDGCLFHVSTISVFELNYGVWKSAQPHLSHGRLQDFLTDQIVILPFDHDDALAAGRIRSELNRRKQPIGPYDTLIAGQAIARGLTLVTANVREFARVDGLLWEDWGNIAPSSR